MAVNYVAVVSAVSAGVSGAQTWVPLDVHSPFKPVTVFVEALAPVGASYTVESTLMNVLADASVARAQTMPQPDASGADTSLDVTYDNPIRAVRLWVTPVASGANRFTFRVLQ